MFKQFLAEVSSTSTSITTPTPTATVSASITSNLSPAATTPITWPPGVIPWAIAVVAIVFAVILFVRAQHHKAQAAAGGASSPDSASDRESFFRNEIARILLYASIGGLVIIGGLIILLSCAGASATAMDKAKTVFDALLPVFGTWVGTLLAFYFGKANFESGARVAQGVGADRLRSVAVRDKMIGPGKITTLPPDLQGKQNSDIPLKKVSDHLKSKNLDRLPLFAGNKDSGVAEKVVHLSKIDKYIADKVLKPPAAVAAGGEQGNAPPNPAAPADLSLDNLFKDQPESTFKNFTFVKESATLADAKVAMDSMTNTPGVEGNCYDVFVTATGDGKEPVIGWITNDIVNENAKV